MDESLEAPTRIHHFHCACVRERETGHDADYGRVGRQLNGNGGRFLALRRFLV